MNLADIKDLVQDKNTEALKRLGHRGPEVWDQINAELEILKGKADAGLPLAPQAVSELLQSSIASLQSYASQELGRLIHDYNQDGALDTALADGLKLGVLTNNANGCLNALCLTAKPDKAFLDEAMEYAQAQGLSSNYNTLSLQGHGAVDVLRRAQNPEEVVRLRKKAVGDFQEEQHTKAKALQARYENITSEELRQECESIFNNPDVKAEQAHHLGAALGGGKIASRTNIVVEKDGENFTIKLAQNGLFPQSCFDPLFKAQDWAKDNGGKVDWSGDGGRNEWAEITVPANKVGSFLEKAGSSRPSAPSFIQAPVPPRSL